MTIPGWPDRQEYPFEKPHFFRTPAGSMHYVDEGNGEPVIFIQGNGGGSFEFRRLIREFSRTDRCIAPDPIGFGLSDKPAGWSYLPEEHAKNPALFLESSAPENSTLVAGDWGGLTRGMKNLQGGSGS
jgi:haloalkane dehalogenase